MDSIDKIPKASTLFVCTANQCRSPMAEVLFRQHVQTVGYNNKTWFVASAGCWAFPDLPATKNAILTAGNLGCDLHMHSSQAVSEPLLQKFNLVLCMEADHKVFIQRNFPDHAKKVFLFSEMIEQENDIKDPVGSGPDRYAITANEIINIFTTGFEKIFMLSTTPMK